MHLGTWIWNQIYSPTWTVEIKWCLSLAIIYFTDLATRSSCMLLWIIFILLWEQVDIWYLAVTRCRCACAFIFFSNKKKARLCHPCVSTTEGRKKKKQKTTKNRKKYLEILKLLILEQYFLLLSFAKRCQEFQKRIMTGRVKFIMFWWDWKEKMVIWCYFLVCKVRQTKQLKESLCKRNVTELHSRKKREKVLINHLGIFGSSFSFLQFYYF